MPKGELNDDYTPPIDTSKVLLVRGSTLKRIFDLLRRNHVTAPDGSGITARTDANGTSISLTNPSGGNGAGGLGPVVFAGTASGQVAYFLVNASGTAYSTPPTDAKGNPYPIANPP